MAAHLDRRGRSQYVIGHAYLILTRAGVRLEVRNIGSPSRAKREAPGLEVALRYFSLRVLNTIPPLLLHSYHTEIH